MRQVMVLVQGYLLDPPAGGGGGGSPPLGIWGGTPPTWIDNTLPGNQPGGPVRPWGPINYPDQGLPGQQPRPWGPIFYPDQGLPGLQPGGPVRPWGPINYPDQGLPPVYYPPVIWDPARPTNPIVNPGDPNNPGAGQGGGEQPPAQGIEWKVAWSPSTGWIVVGMPTGPTPTPSGGEEAENPNL